MRQYDTPIPAVLPTRGHPLKGHQARQVATWLVRWSRRKPVCPLSPRAHTWLLGARRGRWPLQAGRFYAILAYVTRRKAEMTPAPLQLTLGPQLTVNWGERNPSMGHGSAGRGNPPPLIPQRNFRLDG